MIRLGATCSVLVCSVALLIGCGGKNAPQFIDTASSAGAMSVAHAGGGGDAGDSGDSGGSGGAAGGSTSALAPKVTITTPTAATDPNVDAVLISDQITVLCTASKSTTKGADDVDPASVKISLLGADGKEIKSLAGAATKNDDEYSGAFVLGAVPAGAVSFQCSASDKASTPHAATDTVATFVDHGPEITIVQPEDGSAHNLAGALAVEFDTAPAPLSDDDKQATVSDVSLTVYGVKITPASKGSGKYTASVNFADKDLYTTTPTGQIPIVITASNKRKAPGAATQSLSYNITLDGAGPDIAISAPGPSAVVGPASVLKFTVTDAGAGVDNDTVTVNLNQTPYVYSATDGKWTVDTQGNFTFQFGAELNSKAQKMNTQVTVNVLATDKAGNVSTGSSNVYNLDNQPPILDLDPPNLYEERAGTAADKKVCSDYFDPVGDDAPNDESTQVNFGRFRSIVYDTTNTKAGQTDFYFALTDQTSVQLFVQYDMSSPLLADDDGDGVCDEIWTGSLPHQKKPTDQPIPYLNLHPLVPNTVGAGDVTYSNNTDTPIDAECTGGVESSAPKLCLDHTSDMSVVIHHAVGIKEPVIYAKDPLDSSQQVCTGTEWEVSAAISKVNEGNTYLGWVCLATRAVDTVGNVGISRPLRICLDDGTNPQRCDGVSPPSCTDNCTPPPAFPNMIVSHLQ